MLLPRVKLRGNQLSVCSQSCLWVEVPQHDLPNTAATTYTHSPEPPATPPRKKCVEDSNPAHLAAFHQKLEVQGILGFSVLFKRITQDRNKVSSG